MTRLGLLLAALLLGGASGCGGDPDPPTAPQEQQAEPQAAQEVEAEPPARQAATPPSSEVEPPPEPALGRLVEFSAAEIATGFESINFYHDIPGLLRDLSDAELSALGERARDPELANGQGFASSASGELIFVITILHESAEAAAGIVQLIGAGPVADALSFISPDETLFEAATMSGPTVGDQSLRISLRYGREQDGERARDVSSDLVVFAQGTAVVFVLRSATTADLRTANLHPATDLGTIAELISGRMQSPSN